MLNRIANNFPKLLSRPLVVAAGVLVILALFILPLPSAILDILIVCNIALALFLLLQALYSGHISSFFSFPSVLLLSTFYRLSLNVSSTRLILLNGDSGMGAAGRVIQSFGEIVVRGDFVVGGIVFVIISIVNFVVIAKGSARVAEVSARFMLDSLPGRQIAIDADLRSGNITREQASERREALASESHFFGAMDGAMKFVQGDAIAGLLITSINAFGGVAIGVYRGLDLSQAINSFGVLTIGDGLVNIIPALLISVAAGTIVTQVSSSKPEQVTQSKGLEIGVLVTSVFALLAISLLPGFPLLPFVIVATLMTLAFFSFGNRKEKWNNSSLMIHSREHSGENAISLTQQTLAIGDGSFANVSRVEQLSAYVAEQYLKEARIKNSSWVKDIERFAMEIRLDIVKRLGLSIPLVQIFPRDNLSPTSIVIEVRGTQVAQLEYPLSSLFVPLAATQLRAFGVETVASAEHPLSLVAGSWVSSQQNLAFLSELGVKSYSLPEYWVLASYGVALDNLDDLLGQEEVQPLIDTANDLNGELYQAIFGSGVLSVADFAELIKNLVSEGVSVKDGRKILEEVSLFLSQSQPLPKEELILELHQGLRQRFRRSIVAPYVTNTNALRVFTLDNEVEKIFSDSSRYWDSPRDLVAIDPEIDQILTERLKVLSTPIRERGMGPVIFLCADEIRAVLYAYIRQRFVSSRWVKVIGNSEIINGLKLEQIGVLKV